MDLVSVARRWRLRGATSVRISAYADAKINVTERDDATGFPLKWEGELCTLTDELMIDTVTGDGRIIANPDGPLWLAHGGNGILNPQFHNGVPVAPMPLALAWQPKDVQGHDEASNHGTIDDVWIADGKVMGKGTFLLLTDEDIEFALKVDAGLANLVSVDLDAVCTEDAFVNDDSTVEFVSQLIESGTLSAEELNTGVRVRQEAAIIPGRSSQYTLAASAAGIERWSLVPYIRDQTLLADATMTWPSKYFERPTFNQAETWIHVDAPDDNNIRRVSGYIAAWGVPHVSFSGKMVLAPKAKKGGYYKFHSTRKQTDQGPIDLGGLPWANGHASHDVTPELAKAFYDDVRNRVGYIKVGEDKHGIWFSGVLKTHVGAEILEDLDGSPLSGDWRGGELIAACPVITPGFSRLLSVAASAASCGGYVYEYGEGDFMLVASGAPDLKLSDEPIISTDVPAPAVTETVSPVGEIGGNIATEIAPVNTPISTGTSPNIATEIGEEIAVTNGEENPSIDDENPATDPSEDDPAIDTGDDPVTPEEIEEGITGQPGSDVPDPDQPVDSDQIKTAVAAAKIKAQIIMSQSRARKVLQEMR